MFTPTNYQTCQIEECSYWAIVLFHAEMVALELVGAKIDSGAEGALALRLICERARLTSGLLPLNTTYRRHIRKTVDT